MKAKAILLIAVLTLSVTSPAQEKDKDKKEDTAKPAAIRVCVAQIRNIARRSVGLAQQGERLMKELNRNKASKKAFDQRRIEAVAIAGETPGGVDTLPRDQRCDFTLYVTLAELRDVSDFKTQREQIEDLGRPPATGSRLEPQTWAKVDYSLQRGGNPTPVLQSSVSAQENMTEEPTVQQLMDRIAQRIGSAVREKPEVMRE